MFKRFYLVVRERGRRNPAVSKAVYLAQALLKSNFNTLATRRTAQGSTGAGAGVAICCRIRDEGRYLREWMEYYIAAGISHFFFYEKLSTDDFKAVLDPYVRRGLVTIEEDWPHVPISPSAEEDCVLRAIGKYKWVGFIDADEFVVVRSGCSIPEFLEGYEQAPAVALHWLMFGSSGHKVRPTGPVIEEYTSRAGHPDIHVKCFARPETLANYRNSHSWFYYHSGVAFDEHLRPVYGTFGTPATADFAWINHYHLKSDDDYLEKCQRSSVLDAVGQRYNNRSLQNRLEGETIYNEVSDDSAARYYFARCGCLMSEQLTTRAEV